MTKLLQDTAQRAIRYLAELDDRGVAPSVEAVAALGALDTSLPDRPTDPAEVLDLLDTYGSPATTANTGGRYYGFVTGGVLPAALAASWMSSTWDQNGFGYTNSPVAVVLEEIALRWLVDLLGLPSGCGGAFVTGATMANFTALAAARHAVLKRTGWDVEADGLFGAPPITVLIGEEAHPTLTKSLGLLGLGRNRVVKVPVDDQGRMRVDALPDIAGPTIICTQAGNVNTGAIDPICELSDRSDHSGAWVHVDGAFGLWAQAAPQRRYLTAGIEKADSWATDAHKWLNVTYDCGLAFVKDPAALRAAMSISAVYLPQTTRREPLHYTPEASRRARGIEIWATLRSLGRTGVADLMEDNCRMATRFAEKLQQAGFEIVNEVMLNQVLVSFGTPEHTLAVIKRIQEDGTCWCGSTVWQGRTAMRISVSSWTTTEEDVDRSVEAMIRCEGIERG
ncbi:MAG TPA: aspartate aminotransferase family protein [Candidatus Latescibacteria bacterium]|nr:aspartate aminotransferase family protein [Candidatus Latescibacterota bacterium]